MSIDPRTIVALTDLQMRLLQALADGLSPALVPGHLGIKRWRYKRELTEIIVTLRAKTTTHAVAIAMRRELID